MAKKSTTATDAPSDVSASALAFAQAVKPAGVHGQLLASIQSHRADLVRLRADGYSVRQLTKFLATAGVNCSSSYLHRVLGAWESGQDAPSPTPKSATKTTTKPVTKKAA